MSFLSMLPFLGAAASGLGSFFGGKQSRQETPIQGIQRETIDQILASLKGQGPYSNLFKMDEGAFQKSFVDPAKQLFSSQIAPQIQQQYISGGQQRSTGLDDTLTRAGVDLNQMLNQQYMNFQQGAMNRQSGALGQILGQGAGVQKEPGVGSSIAQILGSIGGSDVFSGGIDKILEERRRRESNTPKGFES